MKRAASRFHIGFPVHNEDERMKHRDGPEHIRNTVLRATFLAADKDQTISTYHLTQAAQLEYEEMGTLTAYSELT